MLRVHAAYGHFCTPIEQITHFDKLAAATPLDFGRILHSSYFSNKIFHSDVFRDCLKNSPNLSVSSFFD